MGLNWARCWVEEFKKELKIMKLRLSLVRPELLLQPQWNIPPLAWMLYRLCILLYTLAWCLYSSLLFLTPKWLIFFSHLTYCLLGIYHLVAFCNLLYVTVLVRRCGRTHKQNCCEGFGGEPGSPEESLCVVLLPPHLSALLRLQWLLYSLSCTFSLTVSFLYWSFDYPIEHHPLSAFNLNMHAGNSAQALLDHLLSAVPVHLAHYLYQLLIGCLYILFVVAYWLAGCTNLSGQPYIYKMLDFGGRPVLASLCILGFSLVCLPVCHFLVWNLYLLRRKLETWGGGGKSWRAWWWRAGGENGPVPVSVMDPFSSSFTARGTGDQDGVAQSLLSPNNVRYCAITSFV